ncbi:MAG: hypothetical protein WA194_04715 [Patescibacteria group bacterium]
MSYAVLAVVISVVAFLVLGSVAPILGGVIAAAATYFFLPAGFSPGLTLTALTAAFGFGWLIAAGVKMLVSGGRTGSSGSGSSDSGWWIFGDGGNSGGNGWSFGDGGSCGGSDGGGGCD